MSSLMLELQGFVTLKKTTTDVVVHKEHQKNSGRKNKES